MAMMTIMIEPCIQLSCYRAEQPSDASALVTNRQVPLRACRHATVLLPELGGFAARTTFEAPACDASHSACAFSVSELLQLTRGGRARVITIDDVKGKQSAMPRSCGKEVRNITTKRKPRRGGAKDCPGPCGPDACSHIKERQKRPRLAPVVPAVVWPLFLQAIYEAACDHI
jgi:hypothetical protein